MFGPSEAKAGVPVEGEWRPGPYQLDDGWLPKITERVSNWWQLGIHKRDNGGNATVEACVACYAQTIAMLPGRHVRELGNGGIEKVKTSAASRILRKPNSYQSKSDFMLNLIRGAIYTGNGYAVALRNQKGEVDSLHLLPPRGTRARIAETGDVFYQVDGNPMLDHLLDPARAWMIPQRDILHIRFQTRDGNPFQGISLIEAAGMAQYQAGAISGSLAAFFGNMARPSGVISTDLVLTAAQVRELRDLWNDQAAGMNAGKVPILTSGLKWNSMGLSAVDSQVIEQLKWSTTEICRVMRVPGAMVGDMSGATWNNVEALMNFWLASGLGFMLEHVEESFDTLFGLDDKLAEYMEFETKALMRSDLAARLSALVQGVTGGVYSPNEARASEELPAVEGGEKPRMQQQMVPVDFDPTAAAIKIANAAPKPPAPVAANDAGKPPADAKPAAKPASKAEISFKIRAARDARIRA